ncbi:substrate-binding periplasmic protein [Gallaecimonas sp. GXIMD1310]|uniref:substrate-binding periplasmic protein n=1 Tax=Gallaecimonas sp. GXIMD1310 TaxID=3131926 RepID=UPI00324F3F62
MKMKLLPLVLLLAAGATQADEVRLRGPAGYPFNGQPGTDHPGFFVEAARAIFKNHGDTVNYNVVPWDAMLHGADTGLYDCLLGLYTNEAPELNFTNEPWTVMSPHLFVRKSDPLVYEDLNSFQSRRVGVINNSRMAAALAPFKKMKPHNLITVLPSQGFDELVRRLRMGEIDVIAAPQRQMLHYLKSHHLTKVIRDVGSFTKPVPLYVACSNKRTGPKYAKWLEEGRLDLMRTGQWQALKKKYGVE